MLCPVPKTNVFESSIIYLDSKVQGWETGGDQRSLKCELPSHRWPTKERHFIQQPYETSLCLIDVLPDIQGLVNSSELEIGMTLPR